MKEIIAQQNTLLSKLQDLDPRPILVNHDFKDRWHKVTECKHDAPVLGGRNSVRRLCSMSMPESGATWLMKRES